MDLKKKYQTWKAQSASHKQTADTYMKYYRIKRSIEFLEQADKEKAWEKIQLKNKKKNISRSISRSLKIAAAILTIISIGYLTLPKDNIVSPNEQASLITDSFPETGGRKAILMLDNGEEIDLTRQKGTIQISQGTTAISKPGQLLSYTNNKQKEATPHYNTLQVPRGGEYQVVLEDGTKVWLNAESSLHYPTKFSKNREVQLTGEGYFEVSKSSKYPFIVQVGKNSIQVLGTKFNVSAYSQDEVYTTLAEGSVKVDSPVGTVTLRPNEQAVISSVGEITKKEVDASLFISWAQGSYQFRQTELKNIAEQLSRWYDVEILFREESLKHKRFAGVIFRQDELGFATEVIEKVSNVKFIREGKRIYVTENK